VFALLGRHDAAVVLAVLAVAVLLLGLLAPAAAQRLDRVLDRIAHAVATGVSTVLSWLAFMLGVLPAWALTRAAHRPSLDNAWISRRSAWTIPPSARLRGPDDEPLGARRSGAPDALPVRRSVGARVLTTAVVVAVLTAGVVLVLRRTGGEPTVLADAPATQGATDADEPGAPDVPSVQPRQAQVLDADEFDGLAVDTYAHEDEPWAPAALGEIKQLPYSPDFFLGHRLGDFRGRYVNTVDGRRVSYTPEDPELTVWFFGGSTMLGIGQRDDHTLPSVVARLAEADGIRIRALNFGVSGYVNWQSLEQFEQALSSDELDPPDLAVFYEGVNDSGLSSNRMDMGEGDPDLVTRLAGSDEERAEVRARYPDASPVPWSAERAAQEVELTATQYRRGSELIDRLAERYGVEVLHMWQPSPFAKRRNPVDAPLWERLGYNPDGLPQTTARYRAMAEQSGVDWIDLTRALDEVDRPVYFDSSHTNEYGARLVGEAMYRSMRPELVALQETR
jgi:lysophospholipase L1-like esterase